MKKFKKQFFALFLAFLFFFPANLGALPVNDEQYLDAAYEYAAIVELIMTEYVGTKVGFTELKDAALRGMFSALDPYSKYYTQAEFEKFLEDMDSDYVGVGVTVEVENGRILVTAVSDSGEAKKQGLKVGDRITKINGKVVPTVGTESAISWLVGAENTAVKLEIKRGTETLNFSILRTVLPKDLFKFGYLENFYANTNVKEKFYYSKMDMFSFGISAEFKKMLDSAREKKVTNIILDLRGNPGGSLDEVLAIAEMIIPKGAVVHLKDKKGTVETLSSSLEKATEFKFVLLINKASASASELLASAIVESGVGIAIGSKTYGKGVAQVTLELEEGGAISLTTCEYFTRDKKKVHGIGISPKIASAVPDFFYPANENNLMSTVDEIVRFNEILLYLGYKIPNTKFYSAETVAAVNVILKAYGLSDTKPSMNAIFAVNIALETYISQKDDTLARAFEYLVTGK